MIKAFALVSVPILCGVVFFLAEAPAQTPGVYVEIQGGIYQLAEYSKSHAFWFSDVSAKAVVPPNGKVMSFFVVGVQSSAVAANATAARLFMFVVNNAHQQFRSEYIAIPTAVSRLNPIVYQVTSEELAVWKPESAASRYYQGVLGRNPRSRATIELMVGLVVPDPDDGSHRMYSVRLGPPPTPTLASMGFVRQ